MSLREYQRKRDFKRTPEPSGGAVPAAASPAPRYVIQKHAARQAHYDFRLELDGVLKSWAVPKGPSLDPATKRLAVHVEDHPIAYGDFEGVIPQGEYGGGTVMLWDQGWWEPHGDAAAGYAKGDFKFILHGAKLHGRWVLARMKRREGERADNWLLIKERDPSAMPGDGDAIIERETRSVASGRDMAAIARDADRVWSSKSGGPIEAGKMPRANRTATKPALDPARIAGAKRTKTLPKLTPQLAKAVEHAPVGDDWLHEIKFDGYRMLSHVKQGKVRMHSRNALDWTDKFPGLVADLARLGVDEAVLDGEVVHVTASGASSFAALQDDLSSGRTEHLVYMLFDLLFLDGWDLTGAALEARKAALQTLLEASATPSLRFSDHQIGQGPAVLDAAGRLGLEGIVSKRCDAPYRAGRGTSWTKAKCHAEQEFVIVGFTDPAGERTAFGALLLGYHTPQGKLVYAGRVGTGFTDKQLRQLHSRMSALAQRKPTVTLPADLSAKDTHWVKPALVAQVRFGNWTADKILRHATFIGLRDDKPPEEVVLEPTRDTPATAPARAATSVGRDGAAMLDGIRITHAERVVYPEQGITKLAVAEYYAAAAERMLPHVARRPLSLLRCPEGIAGERFFQKHLTAGFPKAIKQIPIETKDGKEPYVMIEDAAGLIALAQMGVLEIHPWGSTIDLVEQPDRLTFDLDPDDGLGWNRVRDGAIAVRDYLDGLGLRSFPKTTGGKGLHVVVPIKPALDWDDAKEFTRAVVAKLAAAAPQSYTASVAKSARKGRIFIDYLRNGRGATAVAAYSTRARPGATVSTPLTWDEVESGIRSDHFTIQNLPQRLAAHTDPWAELAKTKQAISAAARRTVGA